MCLCVCMLECVRVCVCECERVSACVSVWVRVSALSAQEASNVHIYMPCLRVNCSEFLGWVQSGACCVLFCITSTLSPTTPLALSHGTVKEKRTWRKTNNLSRLYFNT